MEDPILKLSSRKLEVENALENTHKEILRMRNKLDEYEEQQQSIDVVAKILENAERNLNKFVLRSPGGGLRVVGTSVSTNSTDDSQIISSQLKKNQLLFPHRKKIQDVQRTKSLTDVKGLKFNRNLQDEYFERAIENKTSPHLLPDEKSPGSRSSIGSNGEEKEKGEVPPKVKKVSTKIKNRRVKSSRKKKKKRNSKKRSPKFKVERIDEENLSPQRRYSYEAPYSLIGEFNKKIASEAIDESSHHLVEKNPTILPKGNVGIVSVVVSNSKEIWEKDYFNTTKSIRKLRNVIVKLARKTSGSILSNFFFDSFMILFPSLISACEFSVSLQVASNYIPYPSKMEALCSSVRDEEEGVLIFRGLRLKISIECGEEGEDFEVIKDKKLIFGDAVDRILKLGRCCLEGEIVFPSRYLDKIIDHKKHFTEKVRIVCRDEFGEISGRTFCLVPEKLFKRTLISKKNFWFMDDNLREKLKIRKTEEEGEGEGEDDEKEKPLEPFELEQLLIKIWRCSTKISRINALFKLERRPNVSLSPSMKNEKGELNHEGLGIEYISERQKIIESMKENLEEEIKKDTIEYLEVVRNEAMNISLQSPYIKRMGKRKFKKKKKKKKIISKKKNNNVKNDTIKKVTPSSNKKKIKKKKKKKKKKVKKKNKGINIRRETKDQVRIHRMSPRGDRSEYLMGLSSYYNKSNIDQSTQTRFSFLEESKYSFWEKKPMQISIGTWTPIHQVSNGTQTYEDPRVVDLRDKVRELRKELRATKESEIYWKKKVNDNKTLLEVQSKLLGYDSNLREKYRSISREIEETEGTQTEEDTFKT